MAAAVLASAFHAGLLILLTSQQRMNTFGEGRGNRDVSGILMFFDDVGRPRTHTMQERIDLQLLPVAPLQWIDKLVPPVRSLDDPAELPDDERATPASNFVDTRQGRQTGGEDIEMQWKAVLLAHIEQMWAPPNNRRVPLDCDISLIHESSGVLIGAYLRHCEIDDAMQESILSAVYRAAPLAPRPAGQTSKRLTELHFNVPST